MSALYRLVFRGKFLPGLQADQVAANLTEHFGIPPDMARELVATVPGVIRDDLDMEQGNRFLAALANAGLISHLEPMVAAGDAPAAPDWDGIERRHGERRSGQERRDKARDTLRPDRRQNRGRRKTD